jgi:hypothetical protein
MSSMMVAHGAAIAEDALDLIRLDLEQLPVMVDYITAAQEACLLLGGMYKDWEEFLLRTSSVAGFGNGAEQVMRRLSANFRIRNADGCQRRLTL